MQGPHDAIELDDIDSFVDWTVGEEPSDITFTIEDIFELERETTKVVEVNALEETKHFEGTICPHVDIDLPSSLRLQNLCYSRRWSGGCRLYMAILIYINSYSTIIQLSFIVLLWYNVLYDLETSKFWIVSIWGSYDM